MQGTLDDVVSAMLSVASATGLEFPTRSMALELMVTLTETAPALARRCKGERNYDRWGWGVGNGEGGEGIAS